MVFTKIRRSVSNRGFIALISTLILGAILISLMVSVSSADFYARRDMLSRSDKTSSLMLAEGCINVALMALATSSSPLVYTPHNQLVIIGNDSTQAQCVIQTVSIVGSEVTLVAYASQDDAYSRVSVLLNINSTGIKVISWNESGD